MALTNNKLFVAILAFFAACFIFFNFASLVGPMAVTRFCVLTKGSTTSASKKVEATGHIESKSSSTRREGTLGKSLPSTNTNSKNGTKTNRLEQNGQRPQSHSLLTKEARETIKNRFLARQAGVHCNGTFTKYVTRPPVFYNNLYFKICRLRKVASSFLFKLNNLLNTGGSKTPAVSKRRPAVRLVVVRDPYSRLASGYVDRILTNPHQMTLFRPRTAKDFWPNATRPETRCYHAVSFPQLVKYIVHYQKKGFLIDAHFRPMSTQCNPCKLDLDYIVKLETIHEDMPYIYDELRVGQAYTSLSSSTGSMFSKPNKVERYRRAVARCQSMCSAFRNLWWYFKARGLLKRNLKFPVNEKKCKALTGKLFSDLVWDAHLRHKEEFDRSKQKREMMAELYLQVPLEDRMKIRDLFARDFQLFGYDPQPDDLFPELAKKS